MILEATLAKGGGSVSKVYLDDRWSHPQVAGATTALPVTVEVTTEFYFEEGELASSPTFDQTPLEKAAGF